MAVKKRGSTNVGLITTLIFFVLATVILGVTTYTGYNGQEKLEQEKKKADTEAASMKENRNWYQDQARIYRIYMGHDPKEVDRKVLADKKSDIEKGKLQGKPSDGEEVVSLMKTLHSEMPWGADGQPRLTYKSRLENLRATADAKTKESEQLKKDKEGLDGQLKEKEADLVKAREEFNDKLNALKKQADEERETFKKELDTLRVQLDTMSKDKGREQEEKVKAQRERDAADAGLKKAQAEVLVLKREKKDLTDNRDDLKAKLSLAFEKTGVDRKEVEAEAIDAKAMAALKSWRKNWRIVGIDRRGSQAYINLGSADRVVPQLTFSVHAAGMDGRLAPTAKASLEVVQVVGPHLSRARLTSVKSASSDPVVKGDRLFNPTWDPTLKKRVAVAGVIDMNGDSRDSTEDFLRMLRRQGIVVDAYIDLKDGSLKGKGLTAQTDYLILGDAVDVAGGPRARDKKLVEDVDKRMSEMKRRALTEGVTIIGYKKYLDQIGYRATRVAEEKSIFGGR
jgi:hypothetical protein